MPSLNLGEIRPMFNPHSSSNVAIRPKVVVTVASTATPISTVMGMQIMATPRLQIPGQAITMPVTSQTITIRRPSGETTTQQRAIGTGQSTVSHIPATHTLQSPIRTPITAPTLLGIVRPAQPGQLGLVQMQTYPTGLITTASVISQATVSGPDRIAVAKPIIATKHKLLQPKQCTPTVTTSRKVTPAIISQSNVRMSIPTTAVATVSALNINKKTGNTREESSPKPILPKPSKSATVHSVTRTKATIAAANRGSKTITTSVQLPVGSTDVVQTSATSATQVSTASVLPGTIPAKGMNVTTVLKCEKPAIHTVKVSTTEKPITKAKESTTEKPIAKAKEITTEKPMAMAKESTTEKPMAKAKESTTEKPIAMAKESTTEKPIAKAKEITTEKPIAKAKESTTEKPIAKAKESTSEKPIAKAKESTTEKPMAKAKESTTEKPIAMAKESTTEKPIAKAKEITTEKPIAKAKESTTEKPLAKAKESTTEKPIAKAKESTSEKPIAKAKESTTEKPVAKAKEATSVTLSVPTTKEFPDQKAKSTVTASTSSAPNKQTITSSSVTHTSQTTTAGPATIQLVIKPVCVQQKTVASLSQPIVTVTTAAKSTSFASGATENTHMKNIEKPVEDLEKKKGGIAEKECEKPTEAVEKKKHPSSNKRE